MDPSIIVETSNDSVAELPGPAPRVFTWGLIRKGDCTMFQGAKWTLFLQDSRGVASFVATVTSGDDDDAWVIWHVDLVNRDGAILGSLRADHPIGGDGRKFVQNMPSSAERYVFRAAATFDATLWNDIVSMKMHSSC